MYNDENIFKIVFSVARKEEDYSPFVTTVEIKHTDELDFKEPSICISTQDDDGDRSWTILDEDALQEYIGALQISLNVLRNRKNAQ